MTFRTILLFTLWLGASSLIRAQQHRIWADSVRSKTGVPALGYAVVTSDSVLVNEVIGVRRMDTNEPVQAFDAFHIGSNTKAITAFTAARLVEAGVIRWDTKYFDLFPEQRSSTDTAYHAITLRELLSHRAHVRAFTAGGEFMGLPEFPGDDISKQRAAFATYVLQQKPVRTKTFAYSNAGYAIAGVMLTKVTGKSWETLVTEYVARPLRMHLSFGFPNRKDPHQPWGHWVDSQKQTPLPPTHFYVLNPLIAAAGDINLSMNDYLLFIQENLKAYQGKSTLLKPETIEFLQYGIPEYALGWGNAMPRYLSWHDGSAGTFYCHVMMTQKKAVIVWTNTGDTRKLKDLYAFREQLFTL